MTDLASLKRQRAAIKASCTRVNTYVDSILAVNSDVIDQLVERKIKLDSYWSEYNRVQIEIEEADESESNDRGPIWRSVFRDISKNTQARGAIHVYSRKCGAFSYYRAELGKRRGRAERPVTETRLAHIFGQLRGVDSFCSIFNSTIDSSVSLTNT